MVRKDFGLGFVLLVPYPMLVAVCAHP